jgi:hypothetical protein
MVHHDNDVSNHATGATEVVMEGVELADLPHMHALNRVSGCTRVLAVVGSADRQCGHDGRILLAVSNYLLVYLVSSAQITGFRSISYAILYYELNKSSSVLASPGLVTRMIHHWHTSIDMYACGQLFLCTYGYSRGFKSAWK